MFLQMDIEEDFQSFDARLALAYFSGRNPSPIDEQEFKKPTSFVRKRVTHPKSVTFHHQ
jgi:hypothetical protein